MRTHITCLMMACAMVLSAQVVYELDFDSGFPDGMTLVNLDGLTPDDPDLATMADSAWTIRNISAQGFGGGSGSTAAFSVSWYEGDDGPSDDWMILPGVAVGPDPYLNWSAMAITSSGNFRDQYQVFVVTGGGTIEDYIFASPLFDTGEMGEEITETYHSLSLSDFADQTIYIAFRNFTQPYDSGEPTGPGNGGNELAVDNIVVSNGPLALEESSLLEHWSISPNPSSDGIIRMELSTKMNEVTLEVDLLDLQGRVVKALDRIPATVQSSLITYDVKDIPSGHYLMRLSSGSSAYTKSVVLQH